MRSPAVPRLCQKASCIAKDHRYRCLVCSSAATAAKWMGLDATLPGIRRNPSTEEEKFKLASAAPRLACGFTLQHGRLIRRALRDLSDAAARCSTSFGNPGPERPHVIGGGLNQEQRFSDCCGVRVSAERFDTSLCQVMAQRQARGSNCVHVSVKEVPLVHFALSSEIADRFSNTDAVKLS